MRLAFTLSFAGLVLFSRAQNVGIGLANPNVPLHIFNGSKDELLRMQGLNPYISFYNGGVGKGYVQAYGNDLLVGTFFGNTDGSIHFYNNNSLNMVIRPNGNVGIGNNTPNDKLTVQTIGLGYGLVHTNGSVSLGTYLSGSGGWLGTRSNHPLNFFTDDGLEQMTLLQNGNFGLGTTNPQAKLQINTNNEAMRLRGNSQYLAFYDGSNNFKSYIWNNAGSIEIGTDFDNTAGEVFLRPRGILGLAVQSDGRVRAGGPGCSIPLGASGPLPMLSVSKFLGFKKHYGDGIGEWAIGYSSADNFDFFFNGGIKASVSEVDGDWFATSDARLKEQFEVYKPVLNKLNKLDVMTYRFKADKTETRSFGLVAQNLQQYFPELVSAIGPDKLLAISYSKTGVLAIKAIQEQQQIIESLQNKIEQLEKRLATAGIK